MWRLGYRRTKSSIQRSKSPSPLWRPEADRTLRYVGADQVRPQRENRLGKEECMYLLAWVFVGAVVGWGAGRALQGDGYGVIMDLLMGAAGAVAGGFLMRSAGFHGEGGASVTSVAGAIVAAVPRLRRA